MIRTYGWHDYLLRKPSQPVRRFASSDSDEDNSDEDSVLVNTLPSHPTESYNLPAQLVQKYVKVSCGLRLVSLLSILISYFEREVSQKICTGAKTRINQRLQQERQACSGRGHLH